MWVAERVGAVWVAGQGRAGRSVWGSGAPVGVAACTQMPTCRLPGGVQGLAQQTCSSLGSGQGNEAWAGLCGRLVSQPANRRASTGLPSLSLQATDSMSVKRAPAFSPNNSTELGAEAEWNALLR